MSLIQSSSQRREFSAAFSSSIVVSASAGNGGPSGLTVTNVAPWMAIVGAGSMDRAFPANVRLGDGQALEGVSVYGGPALESGKLYELVYAGASGEGASSASDGYSASMRLDGAVGASGRGVIIISIYSKNPTPFEPLGKEVER
jgi:hypothetical protein